MGKEPILFDSALEGNRNAEEMPNEKQDCYLVSVFFFILFDEYMLIFCRSGKSIVPQKIAKYAVDPQLDFRSSS